MSCKYKLFSEIKVGDPVYVVEINDIICKFSIYHIDRIDESYSTDESIGVYLTCSPLFFDFDRNSSNWHNCVFTTKEEAEIYIKERIPKIIEDYSNKINYFTKVLTNIEFVKKTYVKL